MSALHLHVKIPVVHNRAFNLVLIDPSTDISSISPSPECQRICSYQRLTFET